MNEAVSFSAINDNAVVIFINMHNLNITNANVFEKSVMDIFSKKNSNIILDFTQIERIDSTCLGKLIRMNKTIKDAGCEMAICSTSYTVNIVFEISKMNSGFFKFFNDVETALQYFAGLNYDKY